MNKFLPLTLSLLIFAISDSLQAQVLINEFSAANQDQFFDNYGQDGDWIELYNAGPATVNLAGYHLSDRLTNPTKFVIPAGVTIAPGAYRVVWLSDRNEYLGGVLHANFKITQTKNSEEIVLAGPTGTVIDYHPLDVPNKSGHSWARITDGNSNWGVSQNPSIGTSNNNVSDPYTEKPDIFPAAGFYTGNVQISITVNDPNANIYYTLDGTEPGAFSTLYTGPFTLNFTAPVKAIAIDPGNPNGSSSFVDFHTFFVNETHTIPAVSVTGNQMMTLMNGAWNAEPVGTFELFDQNGLRVADASGDFNKHGNDSWAYDQRGIDYITRDEYGDDHAVKHPIFDPQITDRDEFQRVILKAAANDNYPFENGGAHIRDAYVHTLSQLAGLEMDERSNEPCVLYVNGQYWGVYEMREKVDDNDYTKYYYDQGREWIDFLKTWGNTWAEYGSAADWNTLRNYILANDMSVAANYSFVENQLEVLSLIDYVILHSHNVSTDWLNWNTAWWRGRKPTGGALKWRYALWDEDATFGHYINYTGVPDVTANADPCNPEVLGNPGGQGHIPIFNALLNNPDFLSLYINRYAGLNNTYFTCEFMIDLLDDMIGRIEPEMPRHVARWGGSVSGWQNNVQELRDFILLRCTIISEGIVDCYEDEGITGPFNITINVEPPGSGDVQVNTITGLNYPWNAEYFGGVDFDLTALPNCGYSFDHWTVDNHSFGPDQFSEAIFMSLISDDVITAYFINNNTPLSLDATGPLCTDDQPVTLTASPAGGIWSGFPDNLFDPQLFGPGTQTVTYVYTYPNGCVDSLSMDIIINENPVAEASNSSPYCEGANIELFGNTSNNGTSIIYSWTGPGNYTSDEQNPLDANAAGIYNLIITVDGCASEPVATEVILNTLPTVEISGSNTICTGSSSTLDAGGGFESYLWNEGSITPTLEIFNTGTYAVTITDFNGCTGTDDIIISEADELIIDNDLTAPDCQGDCNGAIDISISGGSPPYTYVWSNGEITEDLTALCFGTYSVIVTDIQGCTATQEFDLVAPNGLSIDASINNVTCFSSCDGSIDLQISGGLAPYTFQWNCGDPTAEDQQNLCGGTCQVTVTDQNGCEAIADFLIEEPEEMLAVLSPQSVSCEGACDGMVSLIVTGGTAPYSFLWSNNTTVCDLSQACTGSYSVIVTDANDCTVEGFVDIDEPEAIEISTNISDPGCVNSCEGFIDVEIAGGVAPYSFSWNNGNTDEDLTGLCGGQYDLVVTDFNGCNAAASITIMENQNPEPIISGANSFCAGGTTTLDAGAGFDSYLWSDGSINQTISVSNTSTISVIVTDNNGCSGSDEVDVFENNTLSPAISGNLEFCEGESSVLDAGGGYASYEWSTGEISQTISVTDNGNYGVIVTDQSACSGSDNVLVTSFQNPNPVIAGSTTFCSGSFTTLDAGNYASFLWSTGEVTSTIVVNTPGNYSVDVEDQNGCAGTTFIDVTESTSITPVVSGEQVFCSGGSTILNAGSGFDSYLWSDGSIGQSLEVSVSGTYSVTVSDAQGCSGETSISISEITPPSAILQTEVTTCNTINGGSVLNLFDLVLSGDQNGTWEDVNNSGAVGLFDNLNFNALPAGDYDFVYTTNSAITPCNESTYPVTVTVIDCACPTVQFLTTDPLCNGGDVLDLTTIENTSEAGIWAITQSPAGTNPAIINGSIFDAMSADAGEYMLQFELVNPQPPGCPQEYFLSIDVDQETEAGTVAMIQEVCAGDPEIVILADLIIDEDLNGIWTETSDSPSQSGAFDPVLGTFTTEFQSPGNYTFQYEVFSSGVCPNDFSEVTIIINPRPIAIILDVYPTLDCSASTVSLDASVSSSGSDFDIVWTGPGVVIDGNENTLTPVVDAPGIYTLTITNILTGCESVTWAQVFEDSAEPQMSVEVDQNLDCNFTNTTLQLTGDIAPPFQIQWNGPGIDATNENSSAPEVNTPGTYSITIINPDNGCSSTDSVIVFQDINWPTLIIQSTLEEIDCITPTVDLIVDSPTPNVSFEWFDDQNNSLGNTAVINNISLAGIYSIIVTDENNGCTSSDFIEVINNIEYPQVDAGNPPLINCLEPIVSLDGSASQTGMDFTYLWQGPGITGPVDEATSSADLPGIYMLTVINTTNGCSSSDEVVVGQDIETPNVIINQTEQLDCTVEVVTLDGTGSSSGTNFVYNWLDVDGNIISTNLITEIQNAGNYTLSILNTTNGCQNAETTLVTQNMNIPNAAMIETYDPDCFGDTNGFISVSEVIGGVEPYVYSLNGSSFNTSPIFGNLAPGTYDLIIQDANGCDFSSSVTINEPIDLTINLETDLDLRLGDSIIVEALVNIPDNQIDTIIWSPSDIIQCNDPACLEIGISSFNSLEINATVIDINGCTDDDNLLIQVRKNRDIFIPNVFSPDDDGLNDKFMILANESQVVNIPYFRIFNRWGELVHEGINIQPNDSNAGWDGYFKGKRVNSGVFVYVAEVEFVDGLVRVFKGDVTVIR